ncbi:ABC transporter substrate-binding protein [Paracoccus onubensis]|uniref:ABC transporter substrate-binding protein n=1 Tax=Paracoccus onubensis TaxID=1675788 RepID=UPI00272F1918|nr:ABC transporter substrate-binding protein [Paracoccus onubensis]MDP0927984.1 ABC transporter substrate-binding protein [Paracoccus onubensis]
MNLSRRAFIGTTISAAALASSSFEALARGRKVLIMASSVDIPNFDPHVATGYAPQMLFRNTYDALVRVVGNPPEVVPGLASEWSVSDDQLHYEFTLNPEARFQDGTPVTADAVVYSFERIMRLQRGVSWMIEGVLESGSVTAKDEGTVSFDLKAAFAPFMQVLPWMFIVNPAEVEANLGDDDGQAYLLQNTAGSGPFRMGRVAPGNLYEFLRVEDDWHKDGGNLEGAIWKIVREASTERMMLQRGEAHIALELYAEDMEALADMPGVVRVVEPEYRTFSIKMNTAKGPLADANLRKAISYAYNYQGMLDSAGPAELMIGPLPTGIFGHDPDLQVYRQDMEKAKEYLAKSEYADGGFTLNVMHATGYENQRRWCLLLLEALKSLNIGLEIQPATWPDITASAQSADTMPDFYCIFQSANYADPDNIAFAAYHSSRNGQWQNPVYSNPEADKLIEAARVEIDQTRRAEIYAELQALLVEDAPDIFGVLEKRKLALRDDVEGYVFAPVAANSIELLPLSLT